MAKDTDEQARESLLRKGDAAKILKLPVGTPISFERVDWPEDDDLWLDTLP